jgi:hypothetical protein
MNYKTPELELRREQSELDKDNSFMGRLRRFLNRESEKPIHEEAAEEVPAEMDQAQVSESLKETDEPESQLKQLVAKLKGDPEKIKQIIAMLSKNKEKV